MMVGRRTACCEASIIGLDGARNCGLGSVALDRVTKLLLAGTLLANSEERSYYPTAILI